VLKTLSGCFLFLPSSPGRLESRDKLSQITRIILIYIKCPIVSGFKIAIFQNPPFQYSFFCNCQLGCSFLKYCLLFLHNFYYFLGFIFVSLFSLSLFLLRKM
jgi:hypothetical protein